MAKTLDAAATPTWTAFEAGQPSAVRDQRATLSLDAYLKRSTGLDARCAAQVRSRRNGASFPGSFMMLVALIDATRVHSSGVPGS